MSLVLIRLKTFSNTCTFIERCHPPRALTVPEQSQVGKRYNVILVKVPDLLKDEFPCSLGPFDHETVIPPRSLADCISIEA
jgi:hypothetical protein